MKIYVSLDFHIKGNKNEAILKLLEIIYKMVENYKDKINEHKFKFIKIKEGEEEQEGKKEGYISFVLLGEDCEKSLNIYITVWYEEQNKEGGKK